jgi:hypothetical protein
MDAAPFVRRRPVRSPNADDSHLNEGQLDRGRAALARPCDTVVVPRRVIQIGHVLGGRSSEARSPALRRQKRKKDTMSPTPGSRGQHILALSYEDCEKDDDRQGNAQKPEKDATTHDEISCSNGRYSARERFVAKNGSAIGGLGRVVTRGDSRGLPLRRH